MRSIRRGARGLVALRKEATLVQGFGILVVIAGIAALLDNFAAGAVAGQGSKNEIFGGERPAW